MKKLPRTSFPVLLGPGKHPSIYSQSMKTIIWEKKTFAIFRSCATCITSLRILLGLEFLRNLWNQMGLAVSKWSNVTAPVTEVSESHPYWGHFPFSSPSHPKSEFQRRVICGNLRQCASLTILEARNMWELKTVCQYNDIKSGKNCPELASRCF